MYYASQTCMHEILNIHAHPLEEKNTGKNLPTFSAKVHARADISTFIESNTLPLFQPLRKKMEKIYKDFLQKSNLIYFYFHISLQWKCKRLLVNYDAIWWMFWN